MNLRSLAAHQPAQSTSSLRRAALTTDCPERARRAAYRAVVHPPSKAGARTPRSRLESESTTPIARQRTQVPPRQERQNRVGAYEAAFVNIWRSESGSVVSRESLVSDTSLVEAVTKRSPVSALVITYSKMSVRDLTSLIVVVTRMRLSYRAAEWNLRLASTTASATFCRSSSAYGVPSARMNSVRPISHQIR